jgi:hypothetical protein
MDIFSRQKKEREKLRTFVRECVYNTGHCATVLEPAQAVLVKPDLDVHHQFFIYFLFKIIY